MTIGQKLDEVMSWKGVQQKPLANATGISQSMISEYVRDVREPSLEALRKLAAALDVSPWVLMNGDPLPVTIYDITEDESLMLAQYRSLDAEERETVDHVLRTLNRRKTPKPPR